LSYYNARWYDAQVGRFTSADTIVPGPSNPQALYRFAYALNNPVRYTASSGHGVDGSNLDYGDQNKGPIKSSVPVVHSPSRYPPVGSAIIGATPYPEKSPLYFYGFQLPFGNAGTKGMFGDGKNYSSMAAKEESHAIVTCWLTEACGPRLYFGPYSALTQDIQAKDGVQRVREKWAAQGYQDGFYDSVPIDSRGSNTSLGMRVLTGGWAFARENFYLGLSEGGLGSTSPRGTTDPVGGVIGSFTIYIHDAGHGQVLFEALNITGWESGTRIPGTGSSLLRDRDQSEWGPGGNFQQVFYWWESKPE
jgi:hypothetical protein